MNHSIQYAVGGIEGRSFKGVIVLCILYTVVCIMPCPSYARSIKVTGAMKPIADIEDIDVNIDWEEKKGTHFIIYYVKGKEKLAKDVMEKAEGYYKKIALDLGYPRYSEFWLWDDRVKIYIYPDRISFIKATGQPDWSEGVANYTKKTISSYEWSEGFTESLLPHEIAHLIFRDFIGFKSDIPLWLDEGVAQWAEAYDKTGFKKTAKHMHDTSSFMTLEDMMQVKLQHLKKGHVYIRENQTASGGHGVLFLSRDQIIELYYLQGLLLVDFLIDHYGAEIFTDFCRQLRDGKDLDEALAFAFPSELSNLTDLEVRWRKYLSDLKVE